jgi:CubicO group peptidase (beta-lactamase class C family)
VSFAALENWLREWIERRVVTGGLVLATRHRELCYELALGTVARADGSQRALTRHLRQPFFSFSKAIATTVACQVHARGLLRWDDPVERYVPGYSRGGKEGTLFWHLLTHSAGLPHVFPTLHDEHDWTGAIEELKQAEAAWAPGGASGYHPISGHLLAGWICMQVSGRSFTELSRELLDAIGATSTELRPQEPADDLAVVPAPGNEGPGPRLVSWQPGAGYVGLPEDMLRVIHLHLDRGAGIVPWSSLREMHRPWFAEQIDAGMPGFQGWALGWMLGYKARGAAWASWMGLGEEIRPDSFAHGGFSSLLGLGDPERDVALVMCLADAPYDANGPSEKLTSEARVMVADAVLSALRPGR